MLMSVAMEYGRYAASYMVTINAVLASLSSTTYDGENGILDLLLFFVDEYSLHFC